LDRPGTVVVQVFLAGTDLAYRAAAAQAYPGGSVRACRAHLVVLGVLLGLVVLLAPLIPGVPLVQAHLAALVVLEGLLGLAVLPVPGVQEDMAMDSGSVVAVVVAGSGSVA
jgi:hypothetical protein